MKSHVNSQQQKKHTNDKQLQTHTHTQQQPQWLWGELLTVLNDSLTNSHVNTNVQAGERDVRVLFELLLTGRPQYVQRGGVGDQAEVRQELVEAERTKTKRFIIYSIFTRKLTGQQITNVSG